LIYNFIKEEILLHKYKYFFILIYCEKELRIKLNKDVVELFVIII
jgi:hypothetical protein